MRDIFEKLTEADGEQDRFEPEKDLRSKIIEMFWKEDFPLVGEQHSASGIHLEFKKGDSIVKVVI